jgi:F0F1-type ATP synthase membrane subunit b/b'
MDITKISLDLQAAVSLAAQSKASVAEAEAALEHAKQAYSEAVEAAQGFHKALNDAVGSIVPLVQSAARRIG